MILTYSRLRGIVDSKMSDDYTDENVEFGNLEKVIVALSCVAMVMSLAVFLTGVIFKVMRKRLFMNIICALALSDFLNSFSRYLSDLLLLTIY